jgi:hypothetical protein
MIIEPMTLAEMAEGLEKKKPEATGARLVLSASAGDGENSDAASANRLTRPVPPATPPGPHERLLGTECMADLIPMEWPESEPEKQWNEARLSPVANLGVILGTDRAWLALCSPGRTPLLLYVLPIHGRLMPDSLLVQSEPFLPFSSLSNGRKAGKSPSSPPAIAPNAGSPGDAPSPPAPDASAPER